jgi:ANTAR domain-containing protein
MTAPATDPVRPAGRAPQAAPAPPQAPAPGTGDQAMILARAQAACDHAQRLIIQAQELVAVAQVLAQERAQNRRARVHGQPCRLRREMLHRSAYLRLAARLETMPVIEQAKGILMAQSGCDQDQAFDLLRRASQRSNVPVRELAAQLVANTRRAS